LRWLVWLIYSWIEKGNHIRIGDCSHDLLGNSSDDAGPLRFEAASDGDDVSSRDAGEVAGNTTSLCDDEADE
jgi:hypothetical protein